MSNVTQRLTNIIAADQAQVSTDQKDTVSTSLIKPQPTELDTCTSLLGRSPTVQSITLINRVTDRYVLIKVTSMDGERITVTINYARCGKNCRHPLIHRFDTWRQTLAEVNELITDLRKTGYITSIIEADGSPIYQKEGQ